MTVLQKIVDPILSTLSTKYWNTLAHCIAFLSFPTIGSPIKFKGPFGLRLVEFLNISHMPKEIKEKYFAFIYKDLSLGEIEKEKKIDLLYRKNYSIFIIFDKYDTILGVETFIIADCSQRLPVSYSYYSENCSKTKRPFDVEKEYGKGKFVEVYKLKRAFGIKRKHIIPVINMLFKAVWAKSLQVKADRILLTCAVTKGLEALYNDRLAFDKKYINITYDGKSTFKALNKCCRFHEEKVASISRQHFWMQVFFRQGLITKFRENPVKKLFSRINKLIFRGKKIFLLPGKRDKKTALTRKTNKRAKKNDGKMIKRKLSRANSFFNILTILHTF